MQGTGIEKLGTTALLTVLLGCHATNADMPPEPRRIVTSVVEGRSVFIADGASQNLRELNGSRIIRLWETGPLPVSLEVREDEGARAGNAYREGFTGTGLYIADIPPGSGLDDIPLHRQESLDYIAVLDGEIDLVLPEESRRMRTGDVLIQAGTMHSWVNSTDAYCRLLVVVLTGRTADDQD